MAQSEPTLTVEQRLDLAKDLIQKGEEFYARAADQIIAAREVDFALTYKTIAETLGRSEYWCKSIVRWRTNGLDPNQADSPATPWADTYKDRMDRGARQAVRERPEDVADEIADAVVRNPVVRERVSDALKAAQDEKDRHRATGPERKAAEADARDATDAMRKDLASLRSPAAYLVSAIEEIDEIENLGGRIKNLDYCIEQWREIGTRLWRHGAVAGMDVSGIAAELQRWEEAEES